MQIGDVQHRFNKADPMMVSFITPPLPERPRPTEPPKPQRVPHTEPKSQTVPRQTAPAPVLTAKVPSADTWEAQPPTPVPVSPQPEPASPPLYNVDYLHNPPPAYPPQSKRMREQGMVVLRVHVTPEGMVDKVEIMNSSGYSRLDQTAQDAVQTWKFIPAKQDHKAIAAWVAVPLHFKLGD